VPGEYAEAGRQGNLKRTDESESLHEIFNDNGVRAVNFAISKY
jgi:hypothetical protein